MAQKITVEDVTIEPGGEAQLVIKAEAEAAPCGAGFKLFFKDSGVDIKKNDKGKITKAASYSRGDLIAENEDEIDYSITVTEIEGGYDFTIIDQAENAAFQGNEGVLITLNLVAPEDATPGTYKAQITNAELLKSAVEAYEVDPVDFDFDITIGSDEPQPEPWVDPEPLVGDVVTSVFYGANPVLINGNAHTSEGYPFYFDNGWKPADSSHALNNGALEINNPAEGNYMLMLADWFSVKEQYNYNVRVIYKSTAAGNVSFTMGSWGKNANVDNVAIEASDSWKELIVPFEAINFEVSDNTAHILLHCGGVVGTISVKKVEIFETQPVAGTVMTSVDYTANPVLINGNAHTSEGYPFYFDNGWKPADSSHALNNGALEINNPAEGNYMLMLADWFSVKEQYNYNVRVIYKSTAAGNVSFTMGSWGKNANVDNVAIEASDSWKELIVPFEAINFEVSDNTAHILLHCGGIVGTISIQSVEIYETEPAVPIPDPVWSNIVVNGNCATADNSAFSYKIKKQYYKAQIVDGDGVEGSRGVVVTSDDSPANDWDTQFFITINHKFAANEKFKLKMDYRADLEGDATATGQFQSHKACAAEMPEAGLTEADEVTDPSTQHIGTYIGNISGFSNLTFKNDWQTFEGEGIATADMQSICLNLSVKKESIKYYFDNIVVEIDENKATEDDMAVIREVANEGEDVVTGVKSLNTVEKNGAIYNLAGQKVDKNYKGIVIVNGKKMMMK